MAGEGRPIGENLGPYLGLAPRLLKAALKSLSRRAPLSSLSPKAAQTFEPKAFKSQKTWCLAFHQAVPTSDELRDERPRELTLALPPLGP